MCFRLEILLSVFFFFGTRTQVFGETTTTTTKKKKTKKNNIDNYRNRPFSCSVFFPLLRKLLGKYPRRTDKILNATLSFFSDWSKTEKIVHRREGRITNGKPLHQLVSSVKGLIETVIICIYIYITRNIMENSRVFFFVCGGRGEALA